MQRRLSDRLAAVKSKRPEFVPHFTLARFAGKGVARAGQAVDDAEFTVGEVRLMRSRLIREGALHELDKAFALQPT